MNDAPSYIKSAVNKVMYAIEKGNERILLSMAIGHVHVTAQILQAYCPPDNINKKILIITDRRDHVDQLHSLLDSVYNNNIGTASSIQELSSTPVVIATVHKLLRKVHAIEFDLVIVLAVERMFGINESDTNLNIRRGGLLIGIDHGFSNFEKYLGTPVLRYSLGDAIKEQMLVPIKYEHVITPLIKPLEFELDFEIEEESKRELEKYKYDIFLNSERIYAIASSILERINNEKTAVFCNSQEEAQKLSDALNSISGQSIAFPAITKRSNEVQGIIQQFISKESPLILTSVDLLYLGRNLPNIKNLILLRNTRSAGILSQILATGARRYEGKKHLTVYDFVGLAKLINEVLVPGGELPYEKTEAPQAEVDKFENTNLFSKTTIVFRDRHNIKGVLGVKEIAEELAEVIKILPDERGAMIGIFGKWGRGKTFLMQEVWERLKDGKRNERVDFHAWKYQDTPASWAYLYEVLLHKYTTVDKTKAVRWAVKIFRILKLNINRNGFLPVFKFLTILFFSAALWHELHYYFLSKSKVFKNIIDILGMASSVAVLYKLATYLKTKYETAATNLFLKYSKKHSFKEHLGLQAEIQKELIKLLITWIPKKHSASRKIVLFVDDIDRCNEHKIIQLIDSLRVMLEDDEVAKRVVVITAIDERILKHAVRSKYHSILKEGEALSINALTKEYFDKLFIIGIKLGDLSSQERDEFLLEFIKDDINIQEVFNKIAINQDEDSITSEINEQNQRAEKSPDVGLDRSVVEIGTYIIANEVIEKRVNKLTPEEINMLRSCLKSYDNATPRQIRIFYYRFLLSKNILIKQYELLRRKNIWLTPQYNEIFIKLIIIYSQQEDSLLLSKHKVAILHMQEPEVNVFLLNEIIVPTSDYGELLKALDIVLAY